MMINYDEEDLDIFAEFEEQAEFKYSVNEEGGLETTLINVEVGNSTYVRNRSWSLFFDAGGEWQ